MLRIRRTLNEMRNDAFSRLSKHTGLAALSPSSAALTYMDALFAEFSHLYSVIDYTLDRMVLTRATGGFLDLWASNFYGIQREGAIPAIVSASDKNIKFYVETGTLAGTLGKNYIPQGTLITDDNNEVHFVVSNDTPIPTGSSFVYVSAACVNDGVSGNVKAGKLTTHNLGNTSILVTNLKDIDSGRAVEDDDTFRARIAAWPISARAANVYSLKSELMALPGVADVIINPGVNGVGTVGVTLVPRKNRLSQQTLILAYAAAHEVAPAGVRIYITEPEYVSLKISIRLLFKPGTPESEIKTIQEQVRQSIISYIDSIPVGGELVVNAIRARALENPQVKDVKFFCLKINGELHRIINYKLATNEIFILEDEKADPVEVL